MVSKQQIAGGVDLDRIGSGAGGHADQRIGGQHAPGPEPIEARGGQAIVEARRVESCAVAAAEGVEDQDGRAQLDIADMDEIDRL